MEGNSEKYTIVVKNLLLRAAKNDSCSVLSRKRCSIGGKCVTTMCCNAFVRFNLQYDKKDCFSR